MNDKDSLISDFNASKTTVSREDSATLSWTTSDPAALASLELLCHSNTPDFPLSPAIVLDPDLRLFETGPLTAATTFLLVATPTGGKDPVRLTTTVLVDDADRVFRRLTVSRLTMSPSDGK
ncbi:hypothetical protein [Kitasatospora sp. NPDC008115]|uniref:hypothetical protein n=1 Tax=Kitasatospora sp. NPDC008115 TaxID=3364022 RepID=UPI0036EA9A43